MPGMTTAIGTGLSKEGMTYGSTAQERIMAAARARLGEGEEIIVGELEGGGIGRGAKANKLESVRDDNRPSMFHQEEEEEADLDIAHYTYNSDSSDDGDIKRKKQASAKGKGRPPIVLQPNQLPLPPPKPPGATTPMSLYECQEPKVLDVADQGKEQHANEYKLTDPPLEAPFLNPSLSNQQAMKQEQLSWMVFKFPTRLPGLHTESTLSGQLARGAHSSHMMTGSAGDYVDLDDPLDTTMDAPMEDISPDHVSSNPIMANPTSTGSGSGGGAGTNSADTGYDDTLKDGAAGRYGKIVMYKSGKAYLVVGDEHSGIPPVRMQLTTGLPCGFLQQAVAIDSEKQTYIPLGEVKKSLVVTPDIEEVFPS